MNIYSKYFKRLIDIIISIILLLLLLPIGLFVMIVVAISTRGNPLFIQKRIGLDEKMFSLVKFKTMLDNTNKFGKELGDQARITKLGKILRTTSLDELPQLFNVISGSMSLVGPRPLLPEYLPFYSASQKTRHNLRPGITGWAQVNGRNSISWDEKFEFDIYYVNYVSMMLDFKILLKTVVKVISVKDISSSSNVTMPRFDELKKSNEKEI